MTSNRVSAPGAVAEVGHPFQRLAAYVGGGDGAPVVVFARQQATVESLTGIGLDADWFGRPQITAKINRR